MPFCAMLSVITMANIVSTQPHILSYYELLTLQVAALCGVHAINALLQGPYFSEVDLGQVRPSARMLCACHRRLLPTSFSTH